MIALEVGNLDGLVAILVLIMLGPPILFTIIGFAVKENSPNAGKVFFVLAGLYLIIGLGICGGLMA